MVDDNKKNSNARQTGRYPELSHPLSQATRVDDDGKGQNDNEAGSNDDGSVVVPPLLRVRIIQANRQLSIRTRALYHSKQQRPHCYMRKQNSASFSSTGWYFFNQLTTTTIHTADTTISSVDAFSMFLLEDILERTK
ncbi:hypothetical protein BCR41DRAFT_393228 [Lobosporangium transversale]|uniref:Uncharacterized protein n=1 Tax=Lobosporangium transversale TaxID=64571 RepID=A0A1Y2GWD7_9FUNG|nr:hypothetical protein BCR41DRAFT_393228 [Lobosporangium transversale]ORZ26616.1 hypothetical protein BCR41DRAFT_393228 [Lobosporangium transversale]|eukprot:XP_021884379.1 hypothetical protein BCR41DRAFT_393228 [Lobosporangium transversale]